MHSCTPLSGDWNEKEFVMRGDLCHTLEKQPISLFYSRIDNLCDDIHWCSSVPVNCLSLATKKGFNTDFITFYILIWGQSDHLLYSRTLFLSICSGLDPDDTNPVFSPLLVTYTHTHSHQGVSGNRTSLCVWEKQTINLQHCIGHRGCTCRLHTHIPVQPHIDQYCLPQQLSHTQRARRREWETARLPGRHMRTQRRGGK